MPKKGKQVMIGSGPPVMFTIIMLPIAVLSMAALIAAFVLGVGG